MNIRFSVISVIAIAAIFALTVLSVSARPLEPPAKISITKQTANTGTPISLAANEQVILNNLDRQVTTGTKMPLEELQRFDFKTSAVTKKLDGHAGKLQHVPIGRQLPQCPPANKEAAFY